MSEVVPAAGFLLSTVLDGERRWLLLQNRKRGDWGFPKGHREAGESDIECALRECAEETGIAVCEISGEPLRIQYILSNGLTKEVCYIPAETEQQEVVLSKEHRQAQWMCGKDVIAKLPFKSTKKMFKQFLQREGLA